MTSEPHQHRTPPRRTSAIGIRIRILALTGLLAGALACRDESGSTSEAHEPARAASASPAATSPLPSPDSHDPSAPMAGAFAHASLDPRALVRLGRQLRGATLERARSPLISAFTGVVELLGANEVAAAEARLADLGLDANARIYLSMRPLDHRRAAIRKRLGELAGAPADHGPDDPEREAALAQLRSWAGTLGVHLRAELPATDHRRLLAALAKIPSPARGAGDRDGALDPALCAALDHPPLCIGGPRLIIWGGADDPQHGRLRFDAVYLFHPGASVDELGETLRAAERRGQRTPAQPSASDATPTNTTPELALHLLAAETLALIQTEAVADAAVAAHEARLDYGAYLQRERALTQLLPPERDLDGLDLELRVDEDELELELALRWRLASADAAAHFAPIDDLGLDALPSLEQLCADQAPACARVTGSSAFPRFASLARGGFADTTTVSRVLRQAGERGQLLLVLGSWPNLMGTFGALARGDTSGLIKTASAALIRDTLGIGFALTSLGAQTRAAPPWEWVVFARVGPEATAAVHPLASLARMKPVEISGITGEIERGEFEGDAIYLVDQRTHTRRPGGWLLSADSDARVRWLLKLDPAPSSSGTYESDADETADAQRLWSMRARALGALAADAELGHAEDPHLHAWLDARTLSVEGGFATSGPWTRIHLRASP
ncbi:hypothetical protein G6O69_05000 [Pseudenhygromyxa sp. WMMC2535]|uniref:hypothetical protein n=1 Tax=Pseudenhygromyxa sp. WMMC2535 TaxID=2712867 RepID=UPI0015568FA7|nr:hypothetical protein [Pseudenhygromyxa sp. WMMC2535]NVB37178.1 hypothetical protein [Pseudenhygromyxa sp. WMMC2535]